MTRLTDAEQSFADSPGGRRAIAHARAQHRARHAHLGDRAPAWTDAMEASATRIAATAAARSQVDRAAISARVADALPAAQATRETARVVRDAAMRDAWKGGR